MARYSFIGVYFQVELDAGLLSITVASEGHMTELRMWVGLSYCDGDWKRLSLAKRGSLMVASVDDWSEETRVVGGAVQLTVDSPLYLGGVPTELIHPALDSRSHKHGEIYHIIKVPVFQDVLFGLGRFQMFNMVSTGINHCFSI